MSRAALRHLPSFAIAGAVAFAAAVCLAALALPASAADTDPPPAAAAAGDKLGGARAEIARNNYAAAITELKKVNDARNADWNNLMGYSLRKSAPPDLAAAERHYNEALRIDPQHRGALEYSGELYLMMGNLARAEQRLAELDKACRLPCAEHRQLKSAVERYKASGRHVYQ